MGNKWSLCSLGDEFGGAPGAMHGCPTRVLPDEAEAFCCRLSVSSPARAEMGYPSVGRVDGAGAGGADSRRHPRLPQLTGALEGSVRFCLQLSNSAFRHNR